MRSQSTTRARLALAPLAGLLGLTLSCAIAPVRLPDTLPDALPPVAASPMTPADDAGDPALAAVLAHIERYKERSGLSEDELLELARTVVREARRHDFDPALVVAVIHVESRFDTYAVSPVNALGLMQVLPSTGAWLAPSVGVEWRGPETLFDPISNVRLGVAYLRQLTDRYDGSVRTALLAYNWGPGRIDGFLRDGAPLPREYAQLVLAAYVPNRS
jgi:soluble lytic murein transglycosylase-like protein